MGRQPRRRLPPPLQGCSRARLARALEIEEHSHAGMANRYVSSASNLPFAVLRGYVGTDLPKVTPTIVPITCPFTGRS